VYLYSDRNKSHARCRYLVTAVEGAWCNIRKFVGSQLRNTSYRVKRSECFKVPSQFERSLPSTHVNPDSEDEPDVAPFVSPGPPDPPLIPLELSTPAIEPGTVNPDHHCHGAHPGAHTDSSESLVAPLPQTESRSDGFSSCDRADDLQRPISNLRRSERQRRMPAHLKDFVVDRLCCNLTVSH